MSEVNLSYKTVKFEDFKSKVIVLTFWASYFPQNSPIARGFARGFSTSHVRTRTALASYRMPMWLCLGPYRGTSLIRKHYP